MVEQSGASDRAVTVVLRAVSAADRALQRTWLPAAAAGYPGDVESLTTGAGREMRAIERDGALAGVICWRRQRRSADAIIELVATPPEHARRGSGLRAAALIEEILRDAGVRRIYAPASAAHGISVYFWIRLGYRPLLRGAWPCAVDGVAWFVRDL